VHELLRRLDVLPQAVTELGAFVARPTPSAHDDRADRGKPYDERDQGNDERPIHAAIVRVPAR